LDRGVSGKDKNLRQFLNGNMRILQLTPCFYPAWAYGGPVPVIERLSKELVKRGHEVIVYTTDALDRNNRHNMRYSEIEGIKVFYFRNVSNSLAWRRYFLAPGMLFQLRREIKNFDIVHVHGFRDYLTILIHHYATKYGIPYILQAHGSVETYFQKGVLKRIFDKVWGYRILRDATKLIALTPTEAEQYKSMGISENKIGIVPNGIDLAEFENLPQRGQFRKKYGLDDAQKVVLYLARINKIKGPDLLAKAFAELSKDLGDAKLVIAGPDDGYLAALKQLIRELKIEEKVMFTGPLYGRDKLGAYVDADVYVLPSVYETFPVSVLEACACGTPVIVTDRCGIADVINGQVGLVVTYDKNQLQDALQRVLSDDQMRQKFRNGAKSLVHEKSNWSKIAEQVEAIYEKCVSSKPSKSPGMPVL